MRFRRYMDLYIGLFFLLFTVVYIAQIPAIRMTRVSRIDSAMYPKMIAALLLCLSLAQIYVALKQLKLGGQAVREEQTKREYKGAARTLFLAVAYVVMMEDLGFLISSPIYIFLQILIMCPLEKVRYVQFGIIAIVASGIIYVIFRHGLNLMLPLGLLERLYY